MHATKSVKSNQTPAVGDGTYAESPFCQSETPARLLLMAKDKRDGGSLLVDLDTITFRLVKTSQDAKIKTM